MRIHYVTILAGLILLSSLSVAAANDAKPPIQLPSLGFENVETQDFVPFYKDTARGALAINAAQYQGEFAAAETKFTGPAGTYDLVLTTLTETDGESVYRVLVEGEPVGRFTNPKTKHDYQEVNHRIENVALAEGNVLRVEFNSASNGEIPEGDGFAFSRGRWRRLTLLAPGQELPAPAKAPAASASEVPFVFDPAECEAVFEEKDGLLVVEAEHFAKQSHDDVRKWYLTTPDQTPNVTPDGDPNHAAEAGGQAYLEILPDTRRTHGDKLIGGQNFSNTPGQLAVLYYPVYFNTPGTYYVWARICLTGSEDNGLHVGIDGQWPESGQRMQWIGQNGRWQWDTKQRTNAVHTGVRYQITLDVAEPGLHTIMFSMREDGFELDRWLMSLDRDILEPQDPSLGPPESPTRKP